MKKKTIHLLGFIEFLILLATLLFFVLASEKSMIYLVDKVTKAYGLNYEKLEGNILKNITLHDVTYKDQALTKKAHIDINFKALLALELMIDDITLQKVDLHVIEQMIEDQSSQKKNKTQEFKNIPTISISSLFFSTTPYHGHDINIDNLKFIANDIEGDLTDLSIGSFSFYTESDYTNITADGSMYDKVLDLNHLWITDLDIEKIIQFYNSKIKKHNQEPLTTTEKQRGFKTLVKTFKINNFKTDIKEYAYKKYKIDSLKIEAQELISDLKSISANTAITAETNMWKLTSSGRLENNKLLTDVEVDLNDKYFKRFVPFFDHDKITKLAVALELGKEGAQAKVHLKTDNLLIGNVKDLNLSVENAIGNATLDFKPLNFEAKIDGNLTGKHAQTIALDCNLYYDNEHRFSYDGTLFAQNLRNLDKNITKLMKNTKVDFHGDAKKIQAVLKNKNLSANYSSTTYQNGLLNIQTQEIALKEYFKLPEKLTNTQLNLTSKTPINFKDLTQFDTQIQLNSNLLNLQGALVYDEGFRLDAVLETPKKSLLTAYDKNLNLKALFPLKTETTWIDSQIKSSFSQNLISGALTYNTQKRDLDTTLKLVDDTVTLKGTLNENLFLKGSTNSLKTLQEHVAQFYTFKKEPLDGEVVINGIIDTQSNIDLSVKSRWLVYEYRPNKFAFAEKVTLDFVKKEQNYILKNYYFSTYLDYDRIFFAKKPSQLSYKAPEVIVDKLWLNDQAIIKGSYNIKKAAGLFDLNAKSYHYKEQEGDIYADADLSTEITKDHIKIDGAIDLLKGVITYKTKKEHYIQDDDIIVIQEEQAKELAKKENNLVVDVTVVSKKPISYKVEDTDVLLDVDLKFWKDKKSELQLLGITKLLEGTHIESKKEFKLENGEILFAGPLLNPFLNINVTHLSDPYEITININGLLDAPIINFSATPFLTQSDILSILLFDATTGDLFSSSGDSSKAAISMFGNTFAKELVENFGIKLDKLVLSTTEEGGFGVEVGKKISKKVTILYINDIVQTIKVKYQHSRRFETDITFSPDTSGIDFLYKNEY